MKLDGAKWNTPDNVSPKRDTVLIRGRWQKHNRPRMFRVIMKAAMPVLSNSKHEQFALAIAKGESLAEAYISAGYSERVDATRK